MKTRMELCATANCSGSDGCWPAANGTTLCAAHDGHDHAALLRNALVILVGSALVFVTVLGNLLVLVAFAIDKSIRTISNYFILSLAIADVFIGVISMPLYTMYVLANSKWIFGRFVCKLWLSIDYTVSNASVGNLLVICCDRYLSITRPLTYRAGRTTRKALIMIVVAWAISAILWTPWIFAWPAIEGEERVPEDDCYIQFLESKSLQTQVITIVTAICAFYAPVTLMCVLYMRVYCETRKRRKALGRLQACQRARIRSSKSFTSMNVTAIEPTVILDDSNTQLSQAVYDFQHALARGHLSRSHSHNHAVTVGDLHKVRRPSSDDSASQSTDANVRWRNSTMSYSELNANANTRHSSIIDGRSNKHSAKEKLSNRYSVNGRAAKQSTVSNRLSACQDASNGNGYSPPDASCTQLQLSTVRRSSTTDTPADQTNNADGMLPCPLLPDSDSDCAAGRRARNCDSVAVATRSRSANKLEYYRVSQSISAVERPGAGADCKSRLVVTLDTPLQTTRQSLTLPPGACAMRTLANDACEPALDAGGDLLLRSGSVYKLASLTKDAPRKAARHDKGDSKALRTLTAILLAFIITWSPYNLFTIMNLYCDCVQGWLYIFGYYLCYINSTINPVCYALCNTQFRRAFYKIMKCAYCRKKRRERSSMQLIIRK